MDAAARPRRVPWGLVAVALAAVALTVAAPVVGLGDRLDDLRAWIDGLGAWGPLVFALIYVAATLALLPASVLTIAAGALFGAALGSAVVLIAATAGATLAFLVARRLGRGGVVRWLGDRPAFRRVDALTERHGAPVVLLTRLVPVVPFNLLNYALGLTRVAFRSYVIWTAIGIIPGTLLYVIGGDAVGSGLSEGRVPWLLVGLIAMVAVVLVVAVLLARRRLARDGSPAGEAPRAP
jgi:uncharacterized membrane protein YdjX (TVP38/TMEM64 family)